VGAIAAAGANEGDARMRSQNARPAPARGRLADRLFVGGCTATYVILMIAVVVALRTYGG
jgi:hypothetical protein